jgi:hypothetical protein
MKVSWSKLLRDKELRPGVRYFHATVVAIFKFLQLGTDWSYYYLSPGTAIKQPKSYG